MFNFALADDFPDCDYAIQVLSAAGIEVSAEGSRIAGYVLSVENPKLAQSVIAQTLRFRTGDLHVYFFRRPREFTKAMYSDDRREIHRWRLGLRAQGRAVNP